MTTVGDILDEFFSPFSKEKMWVMPENDNYTRIVRGWRPVIGAVGRTKNALMSHCSTWSTSFRSNPAWKPTKTNAPKPGAFREFVASPPGTEPRVCAEAFVIYVATKPLLSAWQTRNLYTCSIGSFNIYTTVDTVDCAAKSATMNFWMYNAMSKTSFGRFAANRVFGLSGMKTQYMWWNWVEDVEWTTGKMKTIPRRIVTSGW